jgi:hypothetical protein
MARAARARQWAECPTTPGLFPGRYRKKSSFLKKRTKKLLSVTCSADVPAVGRNLGQRTKVFWFFFSKKNFSYLALTLPDIRYKPPCTYSPSLASAAP